MIVFIITERGYNTAFKGTTTQVYSDITALGKRVIDLWMKANGNPPGWRGRVSLENFVKAKWSFTIYSNELDSSTKPKKTNRDYLWEAMLREEKLQKDITMAMLR